MNYRSFCLIDCFFKNWVILPGWRLRWHDCVMNYRSFYLIIMYSSKQQAERAAKMLQTLTACWKLGYFAWMKVVVALVCNSDHLFMFISASNIQVILNTILWIKHMPEYDKDVCLSGYFSCTKCSFNRVPILAEYDPPGFNEHFMYNRWFMLFFFCGLCPLQLVKEPHTKKEMTLILLPTSMRTHCGGSSAASGTGSLSP